MSALCYFIVFGILFGCCYFVYTCIYVVDWQVHSYTTLPLY